MRKQQTGFTLIEVMVVVVILGVLAALVVPRIMDNPEKARRIKVEQDIRAIGTALNDNGTRLRSVGHKNHDTAGASSMESRWLFGQRPNRSMGI